MVVESSPPGGLHNRLLLVTGQVYHEYIGECSTAAQARDVHDLGSMLQRRRPAVTDGDFVVVQVGTGWRLDVRLLDVLVDLLGNVSVYADKKYYSKTMAKHCRNIGGGGCMLLANLVPVLEQFESNAVPRPGGTGTDGGGDVMYDPDWIPVPALPPLPRNYTGSTEKQIEHLTWRLCVRDRRRNLYYKLDKDSPLSALRYSYPRTHLFRLFFDSSLTPNTPRPSLHAHRKCCSRIEILSCLIICYCNL